MEGIKKSDSVSKSSFASDLFGSRETSSGSSSSGIFGSIFQPSSNKALGRESLRSEEIDKKQPYVYQGNNIRSNEGNSEGNITSTYYQEQRVQQPCHLSSSIYYGGQDIYSRPQSAQSTRISRDEGEDDTGSASRGNWWKGSLYY